MASRILAISFITFSVVSCQSITSQPPVGYLLAGHPWIPAVLVTNASRSPCPLLNTFSNHGFLNRNGRNITKEAFNTAMVDVLNFTPDFASHVTDGMVTKLGSPRNSSAAFNLDDFASHNFTDHDASLTRLDFIQGSLVDVQPSLVELLLGDSSTGWLDAKSLGRSRARREAESRRIGSLRISEDFTAFAQLEASFIPLVFGSGVVPSARFAPAEMVKVWLNEERFPIELGYTRSPVQLTSELHRSLIEEIRIARENVLGEYP